MAKKTKKTLTTTEVMQESADLLWRELTKVRGELVERLRNTNEPISDEELATFHVKIKNLEWTSDYTEKCTRALSNYLRPTAYVRENKQQVVDDLLRGVVEDDTCEFWSDDKIEGIEKHY